jgi:hypothetical protein
MLMLLRVRAIRPRRYVDLSVFLSDDLVFSSGAGDAVFLLNAGFFLLFAAICVAVRRAHSHKGKRIPFKAGRSSPLAR